MKGNIAAAMTIGNGKLFFKVQFLLSGKICCHRILIWRCLFDQSLQTGKEEKEK